MMNQDDDNYDPTIDSDKAGEIDGSRPGISGTPSRIPKQIGKYRIKQLIGSGGMGSVYLAVQEQPRRTVALKLMKSGIASNSALRRFEYESQLLARLSHPHIAEVHDAGTYQSPDGGVPYFVMEYISGARRITDYVREKKLSTNHRLELFLESCAAIHYGHTKGVIHRDLKPDNILVDSNGRLKIIDFGVARATDSDMAAATLQTDIGQLVGTVQYMSPEQVEADPNDLDTRSDVYALGVVLYELLCEQLPYDVTNVKLFDATRIIREQEAMRLSTIDSTLRGDVETIVLKALEKDRDRRYQSASELADDIQRYLRNEPINARPPRLTYQVRVFARRHKGVMTAVAAVFAALLLGLAGMSYLYVDTNIARKAAEEATEKATAAEILAQKKQAEAEVLAREISEQRDLINQNLYYAEMAMAHQASFGTDGLGRVRELTDNWAPKAGATVDPRGWEWYYLRSQLNQAMRTFEDTDRALCTEDGIRLGFLDSETRSYTLKDDTGEVVAALPAGSLPMDKHRLSHDAKRLAACTPDDKVQIWDLQTGQVICNLSGHGAPIDTFGWSPDGVWLATAANGHGIKIWNTDTGEVKVFDSESGAFVHHPDAGGRVGMLVWAPDNNRLAVTYWGYNWLWIIDTNTGTNYPSAETDEGEVETGYEFEEIIWSLAWSGDASMMAVSIENDIFLLDPQSFEISGEALTGHRLPVPTLQWGPHGQLASGGFDKTIKIWNSESQQSIQSFRGHGGNIWGLSWNPEGTRLISSSDDGAKLWDLRAKTQSIAPPAHEMDRKSLAVDWAPDNRRLVFADANHDLVVWDIHLGAEVTRLAGHQDLLRDIAWSPDGGRLASSSDLSLRIWDVRKEETLFELPTDGSSINAIAWSPDGGRLVTAGAVVKMWDAETFRLLEEQPSDGSGSSAIAWSPDGNLIATIGGSKLRVWDGQLRNSTVLGNAFANSSTWSPDSKYLATCTYYDSIIKIWSVGTPEDGGAALGDRTKVLRGHTNTVFDVSWNATSDRIVSAGADGSAKVWDPVTGNPTISLTHPDREPLHVAEWSPNGERLLTVSQERRFKIWDASKGFAEARLSLLNERATGEKATQ